MTGMIRWLRPRRIMALTAATALAALAASSTAASQASSAEQVIFSGIAGQVTGNIGPAGFWIWCQDENPAGQYEGVCAGAMYFYAKGITTPVFGEVSGGPIYVMDVSSPDNNVHCTLVGADVNKGPRDTVYVTCSITTPSASGMASTDTAVVNVTGG